MLSILITNLDGFSLGNHMYRWLSKFAKLSTHQTFPTIQYFTFSHVLRSLETLSYIIVIIYSLQTFVSPKCERLVGFSAGKKNMYGVTAVTKGKRCAVALWFTLDPNYKEVHYDDVHKILLNHSKS